MRIPKSPPASGHVVSVPFNALSALEQDTLTHFPGRVTPKLMESLRGACLVFDPLLSQLWAKGMRLRLCPRGEKVTNLRECTDLRNNGEDYSRWRGFYRIEEKLIVIAEAYFEWPSDNQRYEVWVHEVAHAIWYLLLEPEERADVAAMWRAERAARPDSEEYRLKNAAEFFADGFRYYVTPERRNALLTPAWTENASGERVEAKSFTSHQAFRALNLKMYAWLDRKFGKLIDPELLMTKKLGGGEYEEHFRDEDERLYQPAKVAYFDGRPFAVRMAADAATQRAALDALDQGKVRTVYLDDLGEF